MTNLETDLNSVIANAVNARIEAQVAQALMGDEIIGQYVSAALTQVIEIPKPHSSYDKIKVTYIKNVLDKAIQEATQTAVRRVLSEEVDAIEAAVRKELRASIGVIAQQLVGSISKAVESPYGIKIDLSYPSR